MNFSAESPGRMCDTGVEAVSKKEKKPVMVKTTRMMMMMRMKEKKRKKKKKIKESWNKSETEFVDRLHRWVS